MRFRHYLEEQGATIVDPAGEYYDDYYAVFFLDPDGMKLEGMRYGERHEQAARKRAACEAARADANPPRYGSEEAALRASPPPHSSNQPITRKGGTLTSFTCE